MGFQWFIGKNKSSMTVFASSVYGGSTLGYIRHIPSSYACFHVLPHFHCTSHIPSKLWKLHTASHVDRYLQILQAVARDPARPYRAMVGEL